VTYDVIGKMETFDEDSAYISEHTALELESEEKAILNATPEHDERRRTLKYFNTLTQDLKMRLFELYKVDFEMFGYSAEEFL